MLDTFYANIEKMLGPKALLLIGLTMCVVLASAMVPANLIGVQEHFTAQQTALLQQYAQNLNGGQAAAQQQPYTKLEADVFRELMRVHGMVPTSAAVRHYTEYAKSPGNNLRKAAQQMEADQNSGNDDGDDNE